MKPYENVIFITFDIDWAPDFVLESIMDICDSEGVKATFFCTHETPILDSLRSNSLFELGIHPNLNPVLRNQNDEDVNTVIDWIMGVVPEAKSYRSHSLSQSSILFESFKKWQLTHDLNMFIPAWSNIECKPYKEVNDIIRMPYFWEDDVHAMAIESGMERDWEVARFLDKPGLKVFDFHPIHIYLNTEHMQRYMRAKDSLNNKAELAPFINKSQSEGACVFLLDLIAEGKRRGMHFSKISEYCLK